MTNQQLFLLDARAAHAARTAYQQAAIRMIERADELRRDGCYQWALQCNVFAAMAQRAARSEYDGVAR